MTRRPGKGAEERLDEHSPNNYGSCPVYSQSLGRGDLVDALAGFGRFAAALPSLSST